MTPPLKPHGGQEGAGGAERAPGRPSEREAVKSPPVRSWEIVLPWTAPPVKPNGGHGNIYAHAAKVKNTRKTMGSLARHAGIPPLDRCEIWLTWHVGDLIKRDADNLVWTLKPLCDALAGTKPGDHKIVHDDTPEYMTKHMPNISYAQGQAKRFTLTIKEIQ